MSLKVQNIQKHYGSTIALDDVSFEMQKGEILSIAGESGCGKSTLLRVIAGLESHAKGHVYFNNTNISNLAPESRNFGFVFQHLALFPHLTVEKNIFYGVKKIERRKSKLDELLYSVGLTGFEKRYPHELSGGQQQRVALARAIATNPSLLILDEPFSSLDELIKTKLREELFELLKTLKITTILVSHQASDSFLIADNLAIMKAGKIEQYGTPDHVYQYPVNSYVSDFFGASVILDAAPDSQGISTPFGLLSIDHNKTDHFQLFARPEHISIVSKQNANLKGILKRKLFKGPHDVLTIQSVNQKSTMSLETERVSLEVGDEVFLKLPEDKVILFE